jgi:glucosamine--fructose-6-phosphate aminotransferase (isomerizing)
VPSELARAIDEQPDRLLAVLRLDLAAAVATLAPARRLTFVGTGTSQHAAELAAWMFGGDRSVGWSSAASFAAREPRLGREDGVVVISHTGETAFARRALELARAAGAGTVAITGDGVGWEEAIETGPRERSETYTASYTSAALVLARLAVELGVAPFGVAEVGAVPDRVGAALAEPVDFCNPEGDKGQSVGRLARPARLAILTGAGPAAITAREGALKLREAARVAAEGFEAEYLLHGSAVPLGRGDALVAVAPGEDRFGLVAGVAAAAASAGVSVASVDELPGLHPVLAQIPLTARLQRLACRWAEEGGIDPDTIIAGGWADESLWSAGAP